jgi:hypothetical protein
LALPVFLTKVPFKALATLAGFAPVALDAEEEVGARGAEFFDVSFVIYNPLAEGIKRVRYLRGKYRVNVR